jgi:hypothetical protein
MSSESFAVTSIVGSLVSGGTSNTGFLVGKSGGGLRHGITVKGFGVGLDGSGVLSLFWLVWGSLELDSRDGGDEGKGNEFHYFFY